MKNEVAVITGASSGIGREIAKNLSKRGYNLVLVARREDRLEELAKEVDTHCQIITANLANLSEAHGLHETVQDQNVTVLVNCAGFGLLGDFATTELDREIDMINLNISALHILTKLFLQDFIEKDKGHILNVASIAGLLPAGPYMATYYATKAYVVSLTQAINQELKNRNSQVRASALCPGPVDTEFNEVAGASFALASITAEECARYGVRNLFNNKVLIIPGANLKVAAVIAKIAPRSLLVKIAGHQQKRKH